MDIVGVIDWISTQGAEHIELVPLGFNLVENPGLIKEILKKVNEVGIEISNYAIAANFITDTKELYVQEIERVKKEVDIANQLGVKLMRHDVAWRPVEEASILQFEKDLPLLAEACQEIADYAAQFGITTSVENHGFYVQASDRIQSLLHHVNRDNFKTTLDVGNFLCVDEDPVAAVKKNLPIASMVHIKDFYYRPPYKNPGTGWFQSSSGNYLRGAIVGHGDIDIPEVLKVVKTSGYDGYLSIEFEGIEDCKTGTKIGFDNVKKIWNNM